jgi:hypothetical protein
MPNSDDFIVFIDIFPFRLEANKSTSIPASIKSNRKWTPVPGYQNDHN